VLIWGGLYLRDDRVRAHRPAPARALSSAPRMRARPIAELVVDDVGGAFTTGLAYIGDQLGLFAALAALGRASSEALARQTGLQERYVREWLKAMVSAEYLEYDPTETAYFLTPEQRAALVDEAARTFVAGAFQFALPSLLLTPRLLEVFRTGGGIPFGELPTEIPDALDRMHRPWFDHLLVPQWLPGAPGVVDALERGIAVLDVGCGLGRSTVALARAYPKSRLLGIDPHEASIERARSLAREAGVANARFAARAVEAMGPEPETFDLVIAIDCIHDMVDPVQSLRAIGALLSPGGVFFWSEPTGSSEPLENRNPQGRLRASLSPFHCLTVSLAGGGAGLGTIIGESGARALAHQAGFGSFEKLSIDSPMQQFFLLR
jgi:2-polyprenyl-3-methyl-5-hydroxy-6-metoxy-1,4-benzoquinol methylase